LPKTEPTQADIESCRATADDERTLAIGVNSKLLKLVNVVAAQREMMVRDFVIESILKNAEGQKW